MFSLKVVGVAIKEMSLVIKVACLVPILIGAMNFFLVFFGILEMLPGKSIWWPYLFCMGMLSLVCFVSHIIFFILETNFKVKRDRL